ncbi:O-acetyl-ADP-ribose deacetylase [Oceanobacillus massiliensis]|uniref:O-acetyl-ADP-ribose deacetylase n=1 Tax=Oceanobacillus massiliensis TaxID=1465765 RepID=UPI0002887480|nr:O-acetyl-ADP-ribose deacetylase [Oceanobacillus massiliensis]
MKVKINDNTLALMVGDITEQETEAIVNAANGLLQGGGGVDGAIHRAAGKDLLEECQKIRQAELKGEELPTGEVIITAGYNLPANFVIHTVGPVWNENPDMEEDLLANCYRNALLLAKVRNIKSISFPSISTGVYRYPIDQASEIALETIVNFLGENEFGDVVITLFEQEDYEVYEAALKNLMEQ